MITLPDQPGAFVPDLLLRFGLHTKLPGVDVGDRAPHPVVGLTAVKRFLHALPQGGIVDEIEDIDASPDVVQLPERLLGLVLTGIRTQFAHDRRLSHILLRKRCQDALDVRPLLDNQRVEGFARRFD